MSNKNTRKEITQAELDQAGDQLKQVRVTLEAEAQMLMESYSPRVVSYACLTAAIKAAIDGGMTPADFAVLAADTLKLYCGGAASPLQVIITDADDQ
jgi:hypothetical protein